MRNIGSKFFNDIVKLTVDNAVCPNNINKVDREEIRKAMIIDFNKLVKPEISCAAKNGKMFVTIQFDKHNDFHTKEFIAICKENGFDVTYSKVNDKIKSYTISWINGVAKYHNEIKNCKHYKDEICVCDASPYCSDYCPVADNPDICRYAEDLFSIAENKHCNNFERCKECPDYSMDEKCLCNRR